MTSNQAFSDNSLIRSGLNTLNERLPLGWQADLTDGPDTSVDAYFRITAPNKKTGLFAVETKRQLEPRGVFELEARLKNLPPNGTTLVIAPFLSPAVRERLQSASLAFLDLTGNIRLELSKPGLFIETQGADVNPNRKERPSRSLRGPKAGRVVRALIDSKKILGVREIAELADVDAGYVSRVLALLDREALVQRRGRGQIVKVEKSRLLKRWAEESPLESRGILTYCFEPRGIATLQSKLKGLKFPYAITGTLAAMRFAAIAPPRLAMVYVEDTESAMTALSLRAADTGANVLLIEPTDSGVFTGIVKQDGVSFVAASQAAADLLTSPGRGPTEAEELISWMSTHEEAWHG